MANEEVKRDRKMPRGNAIKTETRRRKGGGMEAEISADSRALTENAINEAIRSLGNRKGKNPKKIAADLQTALNKLGTGLEPEPLDEIAQLLSQGEEVIVGIGPASDS
jgi:DNA-binding MurR/RpiR family transcriptional regulator